MVPALNEGSSCGVFFGEGCAANHQFALGRLDQTSVRAEVAAPVRALECIPSNSKCLPLTDNEYTWARLHALNENRQTNVSAGEHSDLWIRAKTNILQGKLDQARWMPSHLPKEDFIWKERQAE